MPLPPIAIVIIADGDPIVVILLRLVLTRPLGHSVSQQQKQRSSA
jgi:hypothetical protein